MRHRRTWEAEALLSVVRGERPQDVAIVRPCGTCQHQGWCVLEAQLVESLPLALFAAGEPVSLALRCSSYRRERRR